MYLSTVTKYLYCTSCGTLALAHLVSQVDLAEAEGAQVSVGLLHRRLDGLVEQLLHKLADVRPHLLHRLRGHVAFQVQRLVQ